MAVIKKFLVFAITVLLSVILLGCEKEGPMERAGESVDKAVEETKDAVTRDGPMERAGERVDETVEDMKDNSR